MRLTNGRYALHFQKSRYVVNGDNLYLGTNGNGYSYACVTFRIQADNEQTIISTFDPENPDIGF